MADDQGTEQETVTLANEITSETGCDLVLYNGPIEDDGFGRIVELIPSFRTQGCMLILVTHGGLAAPAYRIARFMQDVFKPFIVFVPGRCKSAGTLLATGAEKLIMYPHVGELGPLDVQLLKRDEIGEIRSGLVTRSAIESLRDHTFELYEHFMYEIKRRSVGQVRFKTATEIAALVASSLFGQIYEKIDPESLGDEHRDTKVAYEYACRLAKRSKNIDQKGIHRLVYEYPSHDFLIDIDEANDIFRDVSTPSEALMRLVAALGAGAIGPGSKLSVKHLSRPMDDLAAETGAPDDPDSEEPEGHQPAQAAE